MKQPLSAVIITRNAARALEPCLASVAFAEEIVVVDSGSTDSTVEIARRHGARVIAQEWLGYGAQKQFAVERAAHDWVFCLDADERVSDELRESILGVLAAPQFGGYQMPRCNRFMGRWLRHGEGYPDSNLRLFDRHRGRWTQDPVHEHVIVDGDVGTLVGDLLHESEDGLADYLSKQNHYTTLQANELHARGARPRILQLFVSPLVRFVKFYLLRGGFRDGVPGLVHIVIGCMNSFMKYAKLFEKSRSGNE